MGEERAATLEATARLYDEAGAELERAVAHCRVAARDALETQAREHAQRSNA